MKKSYTVSMSISADFYDVDDFNCMVQQVFAIYAGWADTITPIIKDDTDVMVYEWKENV